MAGTVEGLAMGPIDPILVEIAAAAKVRPSHVFIVEFPAKSGVRSRAASPRMVRTYATYAEIELTRGFFTKIDLDDLSFVLTRPWMATGRGCTVYATSGGGKTYLHRQILGITSICDHRNGDYLDNRKANLRPATHRQNMINAKLRKYNRSGFKGVVKRKNLYQVYICENGRQIYVGSSRDPIEAAKLYDAKARKLFGEFARTNADMGLL